jgi:hypothetical protein
MGHQHLGTLPASRRWSEVVALIRDGAELREIAGATAIGAEQELLHASRDAGVTYSFWFLSQIPAAARSPDFGGQLRKIGLLVGDRPTLVQIASAMMLAIDRAIAVDGARTDLGEMAQLSAVESLSAVAGRQLAQLFAVPPEQTRSALAGLGTEAQFAVLSRDYFSRLTRRLLNYFLSRELSRHVGANLRFRTTDERTAFEAAIDLHCREASRIVKEFSGEWYGKCMWQGGISLEQAADFAWVAFDKMREELRERRIEHASA